MKEIMQEYGRAVIAACVSLLLLVLIFGKIVVKENVGYVAMKQKDFESYADAKKTALVMERKPPEIVCENVKIHTGKIWKTEELFCGKDAEGKEVKVEILEVNCPFDSKANFTEEEIEFERQGIYQIWVKAKDDKSAITRREFSVPVEAR